MSTPTTQVQTSRKIYNSRASEYDESHHPVFAQHVVDSLNLMPGERVLDLACGTGLVSLPAADVVGPSGEVVAVDVSDGMLQELEQKLRNKVFSYDNVKVHIHDISNLEDLPDLEPGSFDALSCASALVLLNEPGIALQHWRRYLKPGGRLIVDITDGDNMPWVVALEQVYNTLGIESPYHRVWAKNAASLRAVLLQSGFAIQKIWFKESTGAPTKYRETEEADRHFADCMKLPANEEILRLGLTEKARDLFNREWAKLAIRDGKIRETDGVWIALATRLDEPVRMRGSCACGTIEWIATAAPDSCSQCYCETCRKLSGGPFQSFMDVPLKSFSFRPSFGPTGTPLKSFKATEDAERTFCGSCGSSLTMYYLNDPENIWITAGTFDEDMSEVAIFQGASNHIYTRSTPKWYSIPNDGLPRRETMKSVESWLSSAKLQER